MTGLPSGVQRMSTARLVPLALALALVLPGPARTAMAQTVVGTGPTSSPTGPAIPATAGREVGVPSGLSVALVEATTGQVLVAQDADVRRPIASAIKLLTALVVVDALPPGSVVTVGEEVRGVGGASYGLRPGDVRDVDDLLAGLLLRSGNDVAVALAVAVAGSEEAFVGRMAARLADLGIDARPASASGLEEGDALSALELASVARASLDEPRIMGLVGRPTFAVPGGPELVNRNAFLLDDPTATGLKTGFTNAAGFTLAASAERDGRTLVAVVLGARDDAERRTAARRLLEHGFASTVPTRPVATLGLRTSGGPVAFRADLGTVTLGVDDGPRFDWPLTLRPSDGDVQVGVLIDDASAGVVTAERLDGRTVDERTDLGRALVDGVYAALRPTALALARDTARSAVGTLR